MEEFKNSEANHLGIALPKGKTPVLSHVSAVNLEVHR